MNLPSFPVSGEIWSDALSRDGKQILTGSVTQAVQLWEADTGQRIGPPSKLTNGVMDVDFQPRRDAFLPRRPYLGVQLYELPAHVAASPERMGLWTQVLPGMELAPKTGKLVVTSTRNSRPSWTPETRPSS